MSSKPANAKETTITLTEEERAELLALLQHTLGDTRVEAHRTHTPDFREQVLHKEDLIKALIEKLSHASE